MTSSRPGSRPAPAFCADCGRCEPFTELVERRLAEFLHTGIMNVEVRVAFASTTPKGELQLVCVDRLRCMHLRVDRKARERAVEVLRPRPADTWYLMWEDGGTVPNQVWAAAEDQLQRLRDRTSGKYPKS